MLLYATVPVQAVKLEPKEEAIPVENRCAGRITVHDSGDTIITIYSKFNVILHEK